MKQTASVSPLTEESCVHVSLSLLKFNIHDLGR